MRILSRHLLASYASLFLGILFASVVAIVIIEMLLNFDHMIETGEGAPGVLSYLFLRLPSYYLRELIPIASFAAILLTLGLPARWREITAIKAGGIPIQRLALPLLAAATLLSALALVVNETLVLEASRRWIRRDSPMGQIAFERGSFWYHRDNIIYNVQEADREASTLHGVNVFELSASGRLVRSIRAEGVQVAEGSRWNLVDATIRSFDPALPEAPPTVERIQDTVLDIAEPSDLALLDASASTLSLGDLREYIRVQDREGRGTERYRAMLHSRLSDPLGVLVLALLAIPIGLGVEQTRSIAASALYGIAAVGLFYTIRTIASMFASGGYAFATLSPWLILCLFGGLGLWRFARVPR